MGGPVGRAMRPLSRVVDRALTTMGANGSAAAPAAAAPAITPAPTSTLQPVSRQAAVGKPGLGMQLPSMDGPMTQEGMDSMGDEFSRAWNQHDF